MLVGTPPWRYLSWLQIVMAQRGEEVRIYEQAGVKQEADGIEARWIQASIRRRHAGFPSAGAASLDKFEGRPPFKFTSSKQALMRTFGVRPIFHHASLTPSAFANLMHISSPIQPLHALYAWV